MNIREKLVQFKRDGDLKSRVFGLLKERKWILPLFSVVLVLGFFAPVKAYYSENSWFTPAVGQIIFPIILFCLIIGIIGTIIGLMINKYENILQSMRQLLFGITIGAAACCLLRSLQEALTLAILLIIIVELMSKELSFSDMYADFLSGVSLALIIQMCFADSSLPLMNSSPILDEKSTHAMQSIDIWAFSIMAPVVIRMFVGEKIRKWLHIMSGGCLSFIAVIITALFFSGAVGASKGPWDISKEGEFTLSSEDNTIVFVVDQLDEEQTYNYIYDNPTIKDSLADFTLFDNMVAPSSSAIWNLPALLAGEVYDGLEDKEVFYKELYYSSDLFTDLKNNGYAVQIYTDKQHLSDKVIISAPQGIDNIVYNQKRKIGSYSAFLGDIYKLTGYYAAPYKLKKLFVLDTDKAINNLWSQSKNEYNVDYEEFQKDLESIGILCSDENKKFILYNMEGNESSLSVVLNYIEKLKEQRLYEQSTIIIMGATGLGQLYQNPAVLIKKKETSGEFAVSSVPISFENIRATIMAGLDTENYYGEDLFKTDIQIKSDARMVISDAEIRNEFYPDQEKIKTPTRFLIGGEARDEQRIFEAPIPQRYEYTLGEEIKFCGEAANRKFGATGLSGIEPEIRWTDGTGAAMSFHIEEPYDDLKVSIHFNNVYQWPQRLEIYANEKLAHTQTLEDWCSINFVVPHEWVADGDLELVIGLPDSVIPMVDGVVVDSRRLGISLDTLTIESVNEE